jgi:hypothetical protein
MAFKRLQPKGLASQHNANPIQIGLVFSNRFNWMALRQSNMDGSI